MRGYERDEYEDLDEYEEDGEEQEYEEGDEGEYEEEETHQPTQEELEYLELRQRLKESIRKQMKKESGTASSGSRDKVSASRTDNYGSFFGPSQPVIAQRVIQESKSLLENPHLAARISKSNHVKVKSNKSSGSTPVGSKPRPSLPNATSGLKKKVEMLKNTRDYSFLLSEDAEPPALMNSPPARNVSAPKSEARSAPVLPKSKQVSDRGRDVLNSRDGRKQVLASSQSRPRVGLEKKTPAGKYQIESRKQLGSNNASGPGRPVGSSSGRPVGSNSGRPVGPYASGPGRPVGPSTSGRSVGSHSSGPGRPIGSKSVPSKTPVADTGKKVGQPFAKSSAAGVHKSTASLPQASVRKPTPSHLQSGVRRPTLSHSQPPLSKNTSVHRKEYQETSKPKVMSKPSLSSYRDEGRRPPAKIEARGMRPKAKTGKRPFEDSDDEDDPINMIHKMFGYNRKKFQDDDDVSDMEANFDEIQREEKRSSLIARKEDEEQARLLEEEEERRKMRLSKKRKMY